MTNILTHTISSQSSCVADLEIRFNSLYNSLSITQGIGDNCVWSKIADAQEFDKLCNMSFHDVIDYCNDNGFHFTSYSNY